VFEERVDRRFIALSVQELARNVGKLGEEVYGECEIEAGVIQKEPRLRYRQGSIEDLDGLTELFHDVRNVC
jgi:hypothetical protein